MAYTRSEKQMSSALYVFRNMILSLKRTDSHSQIIAPLPLQLRHTAFSSLSIAFALESESEIPGATINTIAEHIQVRQWRREVAVCDTCLKDKERHLKSISYSGWWLKIASTKIRKCKLDKNHSVRILSVDSAVTDCNFMLHRQITPKLLCY